MTIEAAGRLLAGKRVLVVEDDFLIAEDLVRALEEAGAVVLGPMATVSEALAAVMSEGALDFAVLNIELRGEVIFPVAHVLRQRTVPFIFVTGYDREVLPPEFVDAAWLEKPLNPAKLMRALFSLVNLSRLDPTLR